jgi:large subunit ribosomal protein L25
VAQLNIEKRDNSGKGVARKLRAAGKIPGVCYSAGQAPEAIALDPRALDRILRGSESGMNTLIDLAVSGGSPYNGRTVLVRELQRDPVTGVALHADLFALDLTAKVKVSVPIHLRGHAAGVEQGGIVDHALREIELECLPRAIPKEIVVDVSALEINQSIHVRDLALPEGIDLLSDRDLSVVSVVIPRKAEEEVPVAAAAAEGAPAEGAAAPAAAAAEEGGEKKAPEKKGGDKK